MTVALCFACGATKRGALCPCVTCDAEPDADERLAMAYSDHYLHVDVLRRFGSVIADMRAAFPEANATERRLALDLFLFEQMPERFRPREPKDIPAEERARARAMLDAVELPKITRT